MTVRPRKALGQHFLHDAALLARIAAATGAEPSDIVLEIGPGLGGLTDALLDRGAAVVAIERDARLITALRRHVSGRDAVVVEGDALALDWPGLVAPWVDQGRRWIIAGNIPYSITSPLLAKALAPPLPAAITFLVQREVADRVVAVPGGKDYGALSIGIQAVAAATRLFPVSRAAFKPAPKVDSSVLQLVPHVEPLVPPAEMADFRRLVTSIFSYRRKRMVRAMREALDCSAAEAGMLLELTDIDGDARPEQVTVGAFVRLLPAVRDYRASP